MVVFQVSVVKGVSGPTSSPSGGVKVYLFHVCKDSSHSISPASSGLANGGVHSLLTKVQEGKGEAGIKELFK